MKKLSINISLLMILSIIQPFCAGEEEESEPTPTPEEEVRGLRIIFTTDFHSHLQGLGPELEYSPLTTGDDGTVGGISRIATVIKDLEAGTEHPSIILDGGDFSMGSLYHLLFTSSTPELCLFKELGFLATTLGNHEFDFTPSALAEAITNALLNECDIDILSSNILFSEEDTSDDSLENLYLMNVIKNWMVEELSNGIRVGIFGLMGKDAASNAPMAYPVSFDDPVTSALGVVEALKNEGVDLIICLSHSGISLDGGESEDETLAEEVPEIDVIISGHTHIPLSEFIIVQDTVIVQAGANGEYVGVLDLEEEDGSFNPVHYELIRVDDSILGDSAIQETVDRYSELVDELLYSEIGLYYGTPICETSFDVEPSENAESPLGNLVADSIRGVVGELYPDSPPSFAIEANGIIRDPILQGAWGIQTVSDIFRVTPLGVGPSGTPGYPLIFFYITPYELKMGLEATIEISSVSPDYFLNVSGFKYQYDPDGTPFSRISAIYVGDEISGYSEEPLDTSPENPELFGIAMNLYLGYMISTLSELTGGLVEIVPKDESGNPLTSIEDALIDADPTGGDFMELKEWIGLIMYVSSFSDEDGDLYPDIPTIYSSPLGRISEIQEEE